MRLSGSPMRIPPELVPLVDDGVIDEVLRPLMSGKEAQVFLVRVRDRVCVAKSYKESSHRSFQNRADYLEGRKVRNSRTARAIAKKSKFGREQQEEGWKTAEVDTLTRLRAAGVRVPEVIAFADGVLVMELVVDGDGHPAPRLCDVDLHPSEARALFRRLLGEVVRMLCAGVVHGDLSDFNVLLAADGPVIIDFPQATDAAHNAHGRRLLVRDVDNLQSFLQRFDPELARRPYGEEMWELYGRGQLVPDTELEGRWKPESRKVHAKEKSSSLMDELDALAAKARERTAAGEPPRPARAPKVHVEVPLPPEGRREKRRDKGPRPVESRPAPPAARPPPPGKPHAKAPPPGKPPQGKPPPPPPRAEPPEVAFDDLDALLDLGPGRPLRPEKPVTGRR